MTIPLLLVPLPAQDPIAAPKRERFGKQKDPLEGLCTQTWLEWFTSISLILGAAPDQIQQVALEGQSASIGATDFGGGVIDEGLYRVSYIARIVQPATTSSSLIVSFDWVDGGVALIYTGAAMVTNLATEYQTLVFLIRIDGNSAVRYTTTYASVGAVPMLYDVSIILEHM